MPGPGPRQLVPITNVGPRFIARRYVKTPADAPNVQWASCNKMDKPNFAKPPEFSFRTMGTQQTITGFSILTHIVETAVRGKHTVSTLQLPTIHTSGLGMAKFLTPP